MLPDKIGSIAGPPKVFAIGLSTSPSSMRGFSLRRGLQLTPLVLSGNSPGTEKFFPARSVEPYPKMVPRPSDRPNEAPLAPGLLLFWGPPCG